MAVRRHSIARTIDVGTTVYSEAVGTKPAFWGRVTFVGLSHFHVRDFADGTEWHRTWKEITAEAVFDARRAA